MINTAVILLFAVPALSMTGVDTGVNRLRVPVQDHNLQFSCQGLNFPNRYLFQALDRAYKNRFNDFGYPSSFDKLTYQRNKPYYMLPLMKDDGIHGSEYDEGYYLIFNEAKEIMGGYIIYYLDYIVQGSACDFPSDLTYLPPNW
ncbi:BgTH12-01990 [Blumeria graminis f. sp. triticale]|uniref:Bgt-51503 n=3 Tax=Blumeria graminis TaxID=34373 RepID=A0A9X9QC11_BLUGR|nr:BgTH12-01990 [Blumeria graminis f. sp. triticale]VDB84389.1 Bgt-51504 [Blumeria graminis f. sp. tritici]VDB84390.1 Bgt-51503 [Blumeria graminis f. sp. tritici]